MLKTIMTKKAKEITDKARNHNKRNKTIINKRNKITVTKNKRKYV